MMKKYFYFLFSKFGLTKKYNYCINCKNYFDDDGFSMCLFARTEHINYVFGKKFFKNNLCSFVRCDSKFCLYYEEN